MACHYFVPRGRIELAIGVRAGMNPARTVSPVAPASRGHQHHLCQRRHRFRQRHRGHREADVAGERLRGFVVLCDGALEAIDGGGTLGEADARLHPFVGTVPVR